MVVTKLQTYFEQIPGAVYSANLRDLIREESACRGGEPTIVLDESSSRSLHDPQMSSTYNARPRVTKNNIEKFVENIISCGANLIVIIRGNDVMDVHKWYFKQMNEFKTKSSTFLKDLKEQKICEDSLNIIPCLTTFCLKTTFASIRNEHYTVSTSVDCAHEEVAKIAHEQKCLAVIGQDSNYLIYEGIRFYISIQSMKLETLDCNIYDRNKLIEHLGLKSYQLPLFATLCGNDVVDLRYLKDFHIKVSFLHGDKFRGIAEQVKHTSDSPYKHIKEMVSLVNHPQINGCLISESLDMYLKFHHKNFPKNRWRAFAEERKRMNDWGATACRVLILRDIRFTSLTGFFLGGSTPTVALLRPLRKSIYGILLYDDDCPPVKEFSLEELLKSRNKHPVPKIVIPEKPPCEHPGLMQLWKRNSPVIGILKWGLFCSPFGNTLAHSGLRNVPAKLIFPTVALHYLHTWVPIHFGLKIFTQQFELEAFLVVALLMGTNLYETLLENWRCDDVDTHLLYLTCCFIDTCYTLNLLNEVCGVMIPKKECCVCNFYDGVLVQYVYRKMRGGAKWEEFFDGRIGLEVTFNTLIDVILGNPSR